MISLQSPSTTTQHKKWFCHSSTRKSVHISTVYHFDCSFCCMIVSSRTGGILGALWVFHNLISQWGYSEGSITYGCDNISALRYSFDTLEYPTITGLTPDFDLLQSIRQSLVPSIKYSWRHVKGHQDSTGKTLDFWAQLNVLSDKLALTRRLQVTDNIPFYSLPNDSWILELPHGRVYKDMKQQLYEMLRFRFN